MAASESRTVVVTGATRGAGKGIALALGETGATVYVTGRTSDADHADAPGSVQATAREIDERGGTGIAVLCDHADDEQVRAVFDRVGREQGGLDILVNNAFTIPTGLTDPGPFWRKPLGLQNVLDVGTRSTYVSSYYAADLLTRRGGLVAHTSSFGGRCYMHGPAYGAGKAAVDKMAHDMAVDFQPHQVAVVSLWMGILKTERISAALDAGAIPERYRAIAAMAEHPEFTGRVIDALARDRALMERTGQVLIGAEIGAELGVTDVDGSQPVSHRAMLGDPPTFSTAVVE